MDSYYPQMPSTSAVVNFDNQELDQYFPGNKTTRVPQQAVNYCPVTMADSQQPEYTTLQQASYVPCDFQTTYSVPPEEQTYYTQPGDNSWLSQSSWLKHY